MKAYRVQETPHPSSIVVHAKHDRSTQEHLGVAAGHLRSVGKSQEANGWRLKGMKPKLNFIRRD
jgi:hypothetical protein